MANVGIAGTVQDDASPPVPLPGLTAAAYWVDPLGVFDDRLIDTDTTTASGTFSLGYDPYLFAPDLRVRVFDPVGRLLHVSAVFPDVTDPVLRLPPITLTRADAEGWLVTCGRGSPQLVSTGNTVELLIDNEAAWGELTRSVRAAGNSVRLLLHYVDVFRVLTVFDPPYSPPAGYLGTPATGDRLEDAVVDANRSGTDVWWTQNDFPLPSPVDTADAIERYLARQQAVAPHTVRFARFRVPQFTPMHAKVAVVEEPTRTRGFIPASGVIQEYFDGRGHAIDDPRRGSLLPLINVIRVPVHDVSAVLEGPAVVDLDRCVRVHWDAVNPAAPMPALPPAPPPPPPTAHAVQVTRTLPSGRFPAPLADGEQGILEGYQRAFRYARSYVYLETQYLTAPAIADSLLRALTDPARPDLVAIILLNNKVDIWFYGGWQRKIVARLQEATRGPDGRSRVGVFCLWTHDQAGSSPRDRVIRNYVHSKMAIADDAWATIGSANLSGNDLDRSQFVSWLPETYQAINRGSEVNVTVFDGQQGLPSSTFPRDLRRDLWAEHLGYTSPSDPGLMTPPADRLGWLALWERRAAAKLAGLRATPPTLHPARVLEFRPEKSASAYLAALGVDLTPLVVKEEFDQYDLRTGAWR